MNPNKIPTKEIKSDKNNSKFFQKLSEISRKESSDVLITLETSLNGLSEQTVAERIEKFGFNEITHEKERDEDRDERYRE